jgi:hypothetical protein
VSGRPARSVGSAPRTTDASETARGEPRRGSVLHDEVQSRRQRGTQARQRFLDERRERDGARRAALAAAEHQHLLDQVARPLAGTLRLREVGGQARVRERLVAVACQRDVAHDRGEQVVEVVGDAAGQLPDRLHLLRLTQARLQFLPLGLGPHALGDVARDREDVRLVAMSEGQGLHLHDDALAVLADRLEFGPARLARQRPPHHRLARSRVLW